MAKQFVVGFDTGIETARMRARRPRISLVYPMFNEEENVERAVHFAEAVLTDMTSDYENLHPGGLRATIEFFKNAVAGIEQDRHL